jgi:hypothetical protein
VQQLGRPRDAAGQHQGAEDLDLAVGEPGRCISDVNGSPTIRHWPAWTVAQASCRHEPLCPRSTARLAQHHGTPLWVYDAATVRARIAELRAFDTIRFAQKANSNVHLLRLMRAQGVLVDAVSLGEIERALAAGYTHGARCRASSSPPT